MSARYIIHSIILVLILPTLSAAKVSYEISILEATQFSKARQTVDYNRLYFGSNIDSDENQPSEKPAAKKCNYVIRIGEGMCASMSAVGGWGVSTVLLYFPILSLIGTSDYTESSMLAGSFAFFLGCPVGVHIGAATGATLTGKLFGERGSFLKSWLGASAGLLIGVVGGTGLVMLSNAGGGAWGKEVLLIPVSAVVASSIGAVVGYNWGI